MTYEPFFCGFTPDSHPAFSVSPASGKMERRNGDPTTVIVTCNPDGMPLGRDQGPYGLGASAAQAGYKPANWPRLAEAPGSLRHDLALRTKEPPESQLAEV